MLQNVYVFLPYIIAARTAGIDKNEEITSLSPYVLELDVAYCHCDAVICGLQWLDMQLQWLHVFCIHVMGTVSVRRCIIAVSLNTRAHPPVSSSAL